MASRVKIQKSQKLNSTSVISQWSELLTAKLGEFKRSQTAPTVAGEGCVGSRAHTCNIGKSPPPCMHVSVRDAVIAGDYQLASDLTLQHRFESAEALRCDLNEILVNRSHAEARVSQMRKDLTGQLQEQVRVLMDKLESDKCEGLRVLYTWRESELSGAMTKVVYRLDAAKYHPNSSLAELRRAEIAYAERGAFHLAEKMRSKQGEAIRQHQVGALRYAQRSRTEIGNRIKREYIDKQKAALAEYEAARLAIVAFQRRRELEIKQSMDAQSKIILREYKERMVSVNHIKARLLDTMQESAFPFLFKSGLEPRTRVEPEIENAEDDSDSPAASLH